MTDEHQAMADVIAKDVMGWLESSGGYYIGRMGRVEHMRTAFNPMLCPDHFFTAWMFFSQTHKTELRALCHPGVMWAARCGDVLVVEQTPMAAGCMCMAGVVKEEV